MMTIAFLLLATVPLGAQDLHPIDLPFASYALTADGEVLGYYGKQKRVELRSTG